MTSGGVVRFGTEKVDELMTLERYSHVMHMTSQVSGELADGKNAVDVLRATFPAGTVSGAPKVRAMEIIDELEPMKRGPYAGVVGYLDFSGNLDTAITIRTMLVARRAGQRVSGRRRRRRLRSRRREPGMPQQGPGVAHCSSSRATTRRRQLMSDAVDRRRPARDVVVVSGPDAVSYLQSLVSQDLDAVADGQARALAAADAAGQARRRLRLVRRGDGAWLVCEGGFGEQLVASLQRFKIRVQVEVAVDRR